MSTEIHGAIEYRHPDPDDEGPGRWNAAMDLWPLYDRSDYEAFACLFGVRNHAGFRPPADGRGLPPDLSDALRSDLGPLVDAGDLHSATWADWAEIAALDPHATPARYTGRLSWSTTSPPVTRERRLVPEQWPADVLAAVGPPPAGLDRTTGVSHWTHADVQCRYEPLTAACLLGPGTHWPHVFAVMKALADRFGDHGVRLVVAFN
ncbi:hypothetical protein ABZW03_16620 [Kitasatospora sp. NPDC004799]|uniref:hypothetical protein n=1 Tax=Kitasatospora sp. NPDC004799 TaxID=3154460 RepID=UPI0033B2C65E